MLNMLRNGRLPLGTLITFEGVEYDCARRARLHQLALLLGVADQVAEAFENGSAAEDVIRLLWQRVLARQAASIGGAR